MIDFILMSQNITTMNDVQLPSLTNTISIDAAQTEAFQKNGHTLVKNILNADEIAVYRDVINEAAYKKDKLALMKFVSIILITVSNWFAQHIKY